MTTSVVALTSTGHAARTDTPQQPKPVKGGTSPDTPDPAATRRSDRPATSHVFAEASQYDPVTRSGPGRGEKTAPAGSSTQRGADAHTAEQMGVQASEDEKTHMIKMSEIHAQGERERASLVEQFSSDLAADAANLMKANHKAISEASSA